MSAYLKSLSASSGFLEDCSLEFGPGLTCIIGARGTCKSTLIESVRFAFEFDRRRLSTLIGEKEEGDPRAPTFGIIGHTLRAGSVRCEVEDTTTPQLGTVTIEREVGGQPRIFVDGVREHTNQDLLRGMEVFSQGDLQRIAEDDNDELRLGLIDRPHRTQVAKLTADRRHTAEKLRVLGPKLRATRGTISTLQHEIAQLDATQGQLDRLRKEAPAASPELEAERQAHDRRQRALEMVRSLEGERVTASERLRAVRPSARRVVESVALLVEESEELLGDAGRPLTELAAALEDLMTAANRIDALPLSDVVDALAKRFEGESDVYYQLRQQEQAVNESLKQQQQLKRQVEQLEGQKADADAARKEEQQLLKDRKTARADIQRIDDELYDLRVTEIDSINNEHGNTVQLTLGSSWNSRAYADRISSLLSGSRIRSQEEVAGSIAERIEPHTLIDLTEANDAPRLADLLGRDLGQMTRVIAHLAEHPDLYSLETEVPAARLEVTLFDDGEPKRVEMLSKGQRATALLPIILRPLPYPLLFDQPEDDLDNNFIFRSLIETLRQLKSHRQLIFVTHNANIPVLGGAEKVVVMRMQTPTKAAAPLTGSVDDRKQEILDLLEGGAEAFIERERYYGDLLSDGHDE